MIKTKLNDLSREYATPTSSDMGYGTTPSEFSVTFGSTGTTPLPYDYHAMANSAPYPFAPPAYPLAPPTAWPVSAWPMPEHWERPYATSQSKWSGSESGSGSSKRDKDRDRAKDKKSKHHRSKKERDKEIKDEPVPKEKEKVEEEKPLDLDTRIALLLKEKCAGGLAPSFLALGVDSDDDTTSSKEKEIPIPADLLKLPKQLPLPTSLDSDDGQFVSLG